MDGHRETIRAGFDLGAVCFSPGASCSAPLRGPPELGPGRLGVGAHVGHHWSARAAGLFWLSCWNRRNVLVRASLYRRLGIGSTQARWGGVKVQCGGRDVSYSADFVIDVTEKAIN